MQVVIQYMFNKEKRAYYEVKYIVKPLTWCFKPSLVLFGERKHYQRLVFLAQIQQIDGHSYYIDAEDEFLEEQCEYLLGDLYRNGIGDISKLDITEDKEDADMVIDIHDICGEEYTIEFEVDGTKISKDYQNLPEPPYRN